MTSVPASVPSPSRLGSPGPYAGGTPSAILTCVRALTLMKSSTERWSYRMSDALGRRPVADPGHWLAGRVGVVTGASRGIGAATAEAVAASGAHVILAARDVYG